MSKYNYEHEEFEDEDSMSQEQIDLEVIEGNAHRGIEGKIASLCRIVLAQQKEIASLKRRLG